MSSLSIEGRVIAIGGLNQITEKFAVRELVIDQTDPRSTYENHVPIQFVNDRAGLLGNVLPGDTVRAHFDLNGRNHQGKYYLSARGWKVEVLQSGIEQAVVAQPPVHVDDVAQGVDDDLPF